MKHFLLLALSTVLLSPIAVKAEISNEIPKIIRNNSLSIGNLPPIQANGAEKIISGRTFFQGIKLFNWYRIVPPITTIKLHVSAIFGINK